MKTDCIILLMIVVLFPALSSAEDAAPAEESWTAAHEEGLELYQSGDFNAAAAAFERASQLGAPAPNLYNLARSYQQSGQLRRAIEVFERYLAAPDIPEERRGRARDHRDDAMSQLAHVEVRTVPLGASVSVAGHDDLGGPSPIVITLDPGSYRLEVSHQDHERAGASVSLTAGAHQVVSLTLPPRQATVVEPEPTPPPQVAPTERERWRGGPWLVFGAGAAIALTGVALWAAAYAGSQQDERFDTVEDYNHWQYWVYDLALAGDILMALGATAAAAGLIWLTIDRIRARRRQPTGHRVVTAGLSPIRGGSLFAFGLEF